MMQFCAKCQAERLAEGGVQTRPGRWLCAKCWLRFSQRKMGGIDKGMAPVL
jgi:hypothetical protein